MLVQELDADGDGRITTSELTSANLCSADHRTMSTASADGQITKLVQQLKAAVDSIPSYIERSSMMWVLVPPVKHASIDDAVCDFSSWRRRGWCRMEFAASKLACGSDMPLMVIKSELDTPEFFNPCDIFKLCPARGDFSVVSDKDKVNATLVTMLKAKAASYEAKCGDVTLARILKAFSPIFVPRSAYGSAVPDPAADAHHAADMAGATSAVARLQRFMGWRSEAVEAAWAAETGWNLLTLAAAMDDEDVVDELLARPAAEVKALLNAKGAKMVVPGNAKKEPLHRREPLGQKLLQYAEGMSPLMCAMTFARPSTVAKLIDAGADVERDGLALLGQKPCTFRGAAIAGKAENVKLLLERFPHFATATNEMGACPLHFAGWSSECLGQSEVMKTLLEMGGDASVGSSFLFGGTPLMVSCATYDQDPETVRLLLRAGADPSKAETLPSQLKLMKTLSGVFRSMGNTQMRGFNKLINSLPAKLKQTPTHVAAQRGDIKIVQVLAEHANFDEPTLRDAKGRTPVQLAAKAAAPCKEVPQLMQMAINSAVTSRPASRPASREAPATASMTTSAAAPAPARPTSPIVAATPAPTAPTTKRSKSSFFPRGKSKYRVVPEAMCITTEDSSVTWLAGSMEELLVRHASPAIRRPTAVQQAVAAA